MEVGQAEKSVVQVTRRMRADSTVLVVLLLATLGTATDGKYNSATNDYSLTKHRCYSISCLSIVVLLPATHPSLTYAGVYNIMVWKLLGGCCIYSWLDPYNYIVEIL